VKATRAICEPETRSANTCKYSAATISLCEACKVTRSVGYRYGALVCACCSSFFSQCYEYEYTEMRCQKGDERCDVMGKNRASCRRCRLVRCLRIGMRPLNSRILQHALAFVRRLDEAELYSKKSVNEADGDDNGDIRAIKTLTPQHDNRNENSSDSDIKLSSETSEMDENESDDNDIDEDDYSNCNDYYYDGGGDGDEDGNSEYNSEACCSPPQLQIDESKIAGESTTTSTATTSTTTSCLAIMPQQATLVGSSSRIYLNEIKREPYDSASVIAMNRLVSSTATIMPRTSLPAHSAHKERQKKNLFPNDERNGNSRVSLPMKKLRSKAPKKLPNGGKCTVCNEFKLKIGYHYGQVFSCEECRCFFRWCCIKQSSYSDLRCSKGAERCDSSAANKRLSCRKCRLNKCIDLGMRPVNMQQLNYIREYMKDLVNARRIARKNLEIETASIDDVQILEDTNSIINSVNNNNNKKRQNRNYSMNLNVSSTSPSQISVMNCRVALEDYCFR
jgi:hypothetical protein